MSDDNEHCVQEGNIEKLFKAVEAMSGEVKGMAEDVRFSTKEMIKSQKQTTDVLVKLAENQGMMLGVADKTDGNHKDIENLYKLQRDEEHRLTDHMVSDHTATTSTKKPDSLTKINIAIITSISTVAIYALYNFIMYVINSIPKVPTP